MHVMSKANYFVVEQFIMDGKFRSIDFQLHIPIDQIIASIANTPNEIERRTAANLILEKKFIYVYRLFRRNQLLAHFYFQTHKN